MFEREAVMKKSEMKQLKDYFEFLDFENVTFTKNNSVIIEKTNDENGVTAIFMVDAEEAFTRSLESAESFLQYVEDGREPE